MKVELILEAERSDLLKFRDLLQCSKEDMEHDEKEEEMLDALIKAIDSVTKT